VMAQALQSLDQQLGPEAVNATLSRFADEFPTVGVYRRQQDVATYLQGSTDSVPNREIALEEVLMLWLGNANPAFAPYIELFDDDDLEKQTAYTRVITGMQQFFEGQPGFGQPLGARSGPDQNLIAVLRRPALKHPHSLAAQLEFMLQEFGGILGAFLYRLLSSLDLIKEEEKMVFVGPLGPGGGGQSQVYDWSSDEGEIERFTEDREWMPRLVLIAKNAFVWLDQLSRQYGRPITTLDQVPDEELDRLQRYGISGLWLIGLWERSAASKRIKQIMGNADAVASAYSLFDYVIAHDLGGEGAVHNLRERAWSRGIRLASDMVPNHVGIDGRWVMEHPDWFVSVPYSPFPSYSFNGPDLSYDERVGVFLEDHYYDRSDAAVVFKRVDRWTGDERYIYHGNDGTSLPWNDTAQLNYLNAEVREAVIQTILHVARQFPVIRFDAAMTLAKKHIQRLWFPEPGSGGAIASRADHAMTKAQFDALIPQEFWREVVDRCAVETPDTLLLAEAFWMMEGYFVRTLGMHRVYNSAFMNILRDEENGKYRQIMKNTLEFDPEILKRFVNFMNNPDERTAVDQFGKGDKYFGICTLMATMPGLPMFGHGQIEGFTEKYGMEYRRAYFDEQPDGWLVERHEREIFPLLHRRYLFADVQHFLLYDLFTPEGYVNEDVFAYSNQHGDQRSLVIYHNKYADTRGWIKTSAAAMVKGQGLRQRSLADGLQLHNDANWFTIFRDQASGLEYIRNSGELCNNGMYIELQAYSTHVFLDFREVEDNEWRQYSMLASYLNGRGVPSIDEALREIFLQPIHGPFKQLIKADLTRQLMDARITSPRQQPDAKLLQDVDDRIEKLFAGVTELVGAGGDPAALQTELRKELLITLRLPLLEAGLPLSQPAAPTNGKTSRTTSNATETSAATEASAATDTDTTPAKLSDDPAAWGTMLSWLWTHALGRLVSDDDTAGQSRSLIDEWLLGKIMAAQQRELGEGDYDANRSVALIKLLVAHQHWFDPHAPLQRASQVLESWLGDREVQQFLQVNRHRGILWFNKESLERLLQWMLIVAVTNISSAELADAAKDQAIRQVYALTHQIRQAGEASEYQVDALLQGTREPGTEATAAQTV
jgi:glycosidase